MTTRRIASRLQTAMMMLLLPACGPQQSQEKPLEVKVHGTAYRIPKGQVVASSMDWPFVRVAPPSAEFHLILDGLHPYIHNKAGAGVPTVSRINDNMFGSYQVIRSPDGIVVCKRLLLPHFTCGLQVIDRGVKWGVIFDRADAAQAPKFRALAVAAIRSYRI